MSAIQKTNIPKQMLKEWCETYEEAIETLDYLANRSVGTAKEEIREGLEDYFIDNGLMSEDEFKQAVQSWAYQRLEHIKA